MTTALFILAATNIISLAYITYKVRIILGYIKRLCNPKDFKFNIMIETEEIAEDIIKAIIEKTDTTQQ